MYRFFAWPQLCSWVRLSDQDHRTFRVRAGGLTVRASARRGIEATRLALWEVRPARLPVTPRRRTIASATSRSTIDSAFQPP